MPNSPSPEHERPDDLPKVHQRWVQVRHSPTAPDILTMGKDEPLRGVWFDHPSVLIEATPAAMRLWGFELCCCDPVEPEPDPDCQAHRP